MLADLLGVDFFEESEVEEGGVIPIVDLRFVFEDDDNDEEKEEDGGGVAIDCDRWMCPL
jgi:hypothetical protein